MTHPINPNTDLPMSLEVEKMQSLKNNNPQHQQGAISQQQIKANEKKQQKINHKNEVNKPKINADEKNETKQQEKENKNEDNSNKKTKNSTSQYKKGNFIDVKI